MLCRTSSGRQRTGAGLWAAGILLAGFLVVSTLSLVLFVRLQGPALPPPKRDGQDSQPPPPADLGFESWAQRVAALPAAEQVEAVAAALRELNPDFDGQVKHEAT